MMQPPVRPLSAVNVGQPSTSRSMCENQNEEHWKTVLHRAQSTRSDLLHQLSQNNSIISEIEKHLTDVAPDSPGMNTLPQGLGRMSTESRSIYNEEIQEIPNVSQGKRGMK